MSVIHQPAPVATNGRSTLRKAAEQINDCKRPYIYIGGGVIKSNATE